MIKICRYFIYTALLLISAFNIVKAQNFSSGTVYMCDTNIFTTNVSGIGPLTQPGTAGYYSMLSLCISITTNHPQTLVISLTSPMGTTLLLSAYNGVGGVNYTNCCFMYLSSPSITTGSAPFTGNWTAQGGSLSFFNGQNADGVWTITVIDTACQNIIHGGGSGPGRWTDGAFNGGGGGGIGFGFNAPPCLGSIPTDTENICQGDVVNIMSYYTNPAFNYSVYLGWIPVNNPYAVTAAGTYTVMAFEWFTGCVYDAPFVINVYPQAAFGADTVINQCSGVPINLNNLFNLTGLTAAWSLNGLPITTATASAASAPGVYQLIGQNVANCNDTVLVTLNNLAGFSLGADTCIFDCTTNVFDLMPLYDTTGLSTAWYFNGNVVANPTAVTVNGIYKLVALNANGCSDSALVTLNVSIGPSLGADQLQGICSGTTLNLTTLYNTAGTTAHWTFNGIPVVNPSSVNVAGIYTLIVIAASGCRDTAEVTMSILPVPSLGWDQTHHICSNSTIDLTQLYNTTGYIANWTLNGSPIVSPDSANLAGTYVLIVISGGGCADTAKVIVSYLSTPTLGVNQSTAICSGTTIDLTSIFNATGFTSYWTLAGVTVSNPVAVDSSGIYTLIAIAANGCSDTADVSLNVLPVPSLGANQSHSICTNTTIDLTAIYNTSGYTTNWWLNSNAVVNPASANLSGIYLLIATAVGGCTDTAQVFVSYLSTPYLGANQAASICPGNSIDLTNLFNTTAFTTNWTITGLTVSNPAAVDSGGVYTLIAIAASGCTDTADVMLTILPKPILGLNQIQNVCSNTTLNLTSLYNTSGYTTNWIFNGTTVINPAAVNAAGLYQITVTNTGGCTASAIVTVALNPAPNLGDDVTVDLCAGSTTDLTSYFAVAGLNTTWTQSGSVVFDPTVINSSGNYQLVATNRFGCSDTAIATVNLLAAPSLGSDQSFALCKWMTLDLSTIYNITGLTTTYNFNGMLLGSYTAVYDSGTYIINVSNANGCTDQAVVQITNRECDCLADFNYSAKCLQEPVSFELIADSDVVGAHWTFANSAIPAQFVANPIVKFLTADSVLVTMTAYLCCGIVEVTKYVHADDCSDSCHIYFPSAFSPNDDGVNDRFIWLGECNPVEYRLEIYNRFGKLMFQTGNPNAFWDGKYQNNLSPAGSYVFHLEYKLPYQNKQIVTSNLALIR